MARNGEKKLRARGRWECGKRKKRASHIPTALLLLYTGTNIDRTDGDTSNESKSGTFLSRYDTSKAIVQSNRLTESQATGKLPISLEQARPMQLKGCGGAMWSARKMSS